MKLPSRAIFRCRAAGLVTVCAALAAACTDTDRPAPLAPDLQVRADVTTGSTASGAAAQQLARALAGAMRDADVRVQVRNAMRSSPYNEHKLVLQEFVATRAGRRLIEAAAKAAGESEHDIDALINALPDMDFYAPFQEHRLKWRGDAEVAVGAAMDVDASTFTAYTTDDRTVSYGARSAAPDVVWLFIHPVEPKSRRLKPQANTPGAVIQDPDDGTISTQVIEPHENFESEGGGSGSGGSGGSTSYMVIDHFYSNVLDGVGAAELRFIVEDANMNQITAEQFEGIHADWHAARVVNFTLRRGSYLHLREIDTWDSDDQGRFPIYAVPGWVYAQTIDCFWHYYGHPGYSQSATEQMCGPGSNLEQYALSGPLWRAYLR